MERIGSALLATLVLSACSSPDPTHQKMTQNVTRTEVQLFHDRPLTEVHATPIHDVTLEDQGRTTTVTYWGGGPASCIHLDRVDVAYEPRRLVISVHVGRLSPEDPNPNDDNRYVCTPMALTQKVSVGLSQPIQGRRIVDGACVRPEESSDTFCRERYS